MEYRYGGVRPSIEDVTSSLSKLSLSSDKIQNIKYYNFIELLKNGKCKES